MAKAQKSETTRTDQPKSEEAKSKSKHEASQQSKWVKERTKQVEQWEEAGQETSEVEDLRSPETKAAEWRIGQQRDVPNAITESLPMDQSTEPRWQSTTDLSPSRRRSNELQKGGWPCRKCVLPTSTQAHRDAVYWDTHQDVYTINSYRQVQSPPGCSLLRNAPSGLPRRRPASLPSRPRFYWRGLSRAHTHEVDRMVTKADFDQRLLSQAASGSQCHLPMTTAWEIFYEALHEGSRECRHTWTW